MRSKKYTKSPKWQAALYQQRISTAKRNVAIYKAMKPNISEEELDLLIKTYKISKARLYQIKNNVQKMIDKKEIDLELFGT